MPETIKQPRFSLDRFAKILVRKTQRFLDRDRAVKTLVLRNIHRPHTALAYLPVDSVTLL